MYLTVLLIALISILVVLSAALIALLILNSKKGETGGTGAVDPAPGAVVGVNAVPNGSVSEDARSAYYNQAVVVDDKATVVLEESKTGNRFLIKLGDPKIIGRIVSGVVGMNNIAVSDSVYLSRRAARVYYDNGEVYIENLSKGGTKLNDMPVVAPQRLSVGDTLLMGDVQLNVTDLRFY